MPILPSLADISPDDRNARLVMPCAVCEQTAQRDVKILDALQTVHRVLNGTDGLRNPWLKLARVRAAVDEAIRLMQVRS